jgi:hypothetical protein
MQNLTVHLGSATPLSSRAGPRAPVHNLCLPALTATKARPVGASAPLSEQRRAARARRIRVAAGRDTIEVPPAGRGQAPRRRPAPRGTSAAGPPSLFFPSPRRRRPRRSSAAAPTRSPVSTPLRLLLSSARASPPLPAPGPPPPATGSPLSLVDSGRAPPSSATPR